MQVLNVHGAVACAEMCMHCACHQNVSLTESIAQLKDTEVMTLKINSCTSQR